MPRQFSFRGDRLAYSWGIVLLAAVAFLLLWAFGGDTHALIPLYSVGVFVCFTLSQIGMVRHWLARARRRAGAGGWSSMPPGAVLTAVVLAVVVDREVRRRRVPGRHPRPAPRRDDAVHQPPVPPLGRASWPSGPDLVVTPPHREERVVVPIPGLNRAVVQAVNVGPLDQRRHPRRLHRRRPGDGGRRSAPTSSGRSRASRWSWSSRRTARWPARCSPTSTSSTRPGRPDKPEPITFVVIPEYVARSWWERILYNQSAKRLRTVLLGRPHTVVVNVPYRREDPELFEAALGGGDRERPDAEHEDR